MFRFSELLLAFSAIAYVGVLADQTDVLDSGGRIIGGTDANIKDISYQLSLRWNNNHYCGATLISEFWSVCAAHCTIGLAVGPMSLLAGTASRSSGGEVRAVAESINHSSYNPSTYNYDISLLKVASAFSLGSSIQPAGLPRQGASVSTGVYGVVSGWGVLTQGSSDLPDNLQQISVPVVAQSTCNSAYGGSITKYMLCAGFAAGGRDACQGDSGGPFVINGQLIGVTSFGKGCAQSNYPGVYTRVSTVRNWIRTKTGV